MSVCLKLKISAITRALESRFCKKSSGISLLKKKLKFSIRFVYNLQKLQFSVLDIIIFQINPIGQLTQKLIKKH